MVPLFISGLNVRFHSKAGQEAHGDLLPLCSEPGPPFDISITERFVVLNVNLHSNGGFIALLCMRQAAEFRLRQIST